MLKSKVLNITFLLKSKVLNITFGIPADLKSVLYVKKLSPLGWLN